MEQDHNLSLETLFENAVRAQAGAYLDTVAVRAVPDTVADCLKSAASENIDISNYGTSVFYDRYENGYFRPDVSITSIAHNEEDEIIDNFISVIAEEVPAAQDSLRPTLLINLNKFIEALKSKYPQKDFLIAPPTSSMSYLESLDKQSLMLFKENIDKCLRAFDFNYIIGGLDETTGNN